MSKRFCYLAILPKEITILNIRYQIAKFVSLLAWSIYSDLITNV